MGIVPLYRYRYADISMLFSVAWLYSGRVKDCRFHPTYRDQTYSVDAYICLRLYHLQITLSIFIYLSIYLFHLHLFNFYMLSLKTPSPTWDRSLVQWVMRPKCYY